MKGCVSVRERLRVCVVSSWFYYLNNHVGLLLLLQRRIDAVRLLLTLDNRQLIAIQLLLLVLLFLSGSQKAVRLHDPRAVDGFSGGTRWAVDMGDELEHETWLPFNIWWYDIVDSIRRSRQHDNLAAIPFWMGHRDPSSSKDLEWDVVRWGAAFQIYVCTRLISAQSLSNSRYLWHQPSDRWM